jgi:hypothetical protein
MHHSSSMRREAVSLHGRHQCRALIGGFRDFLGLTTNHACIPCLTLCRSGTYFCVDKSVTAVVIQGLAEHKDTLGAPLCPCRHYDDKEAEAQMGYWNCPCVPMRERKVSYGAEPGGVLSANWGVECCRSLPGKDEPFGWSATCQGDFQLEGQVL